MSLPIISAQQRLAERKGVKLLMLGKSGIGKSQTIKQASDLLAQHIPNWRGVIDLRDILYFGTVIGGCLLVTQASLESRRWR